MEKIPPGCFSLGVYWTNPSHCFQNYHTWEEGSQDFPRTLSQFMLSTHRAQLLFIPQLCHLASSCLSQGNCPCESCQQLFFGSIPWTMSLLSSCDFSDDWVPLTASLLKLLSPWRSAPVVLILPLRVRVLPWLQFPFLHWSHRPDSQLRPVR